MSIPFPLLLMPGTSLALYLNEIGQQCFYPLRILQLAQGHLLVALHSRVWSTNRNSIEQHIICDRASSEGIKHRELLLSNQNKNSKIINTYSDIPSPRVHVHCINTLSDSSSSCMFSSISNALFSSSSDSTYIKESAIISYTRDNLSSEPILVE